MVDAEGRARKPHSPECDAAKTLGKAAYVVRALYTCPTPFRWQCDLREEGCLGQVWRQLTIYSNGNSGQLFSTSLTQENTPLKSDLGVSAYGNLNSKPERRRYRRR